MTKSMTSICGAAALLATMVLGGTAALALSGPDKAVADHPVTETAFQVNDPMTETVAFDDVYCLTEGRIDLFDITVSEMDAVDYTPDMFDSFDRAIGVVNSEHVYGIEETVLNKFIGTARGGTGADLLGARDPAVFADGYDDERRLDELDIGVSGLQTAAFLVTADTEGPPARV